MRTDTSDAERRGPKAAKAGAAAPPVALFQAGPKSRALFAQEAAHLAPGLQSFALFSQIAIKSGRGATLRDEDDREYLDFLAGIGVASLGYSHPEYVRVLTEQLSRITVGSFTSARRAEFVSRLAKVTPPGLDRAMLYSSGAEAVEAALRLAKSRTGKFEVIGFWGGFHGKTGGVLGLLGDSFKHDLGPLMPGLYLSPYPDAYRCPLKAQGEHDCAAHCLEFLRDLIKRSTSGAVGAIIVEPIQGTAGNVIPAPGFLKGLRELSREIGCLLISDEMITGFGRTGTWWGCDHEGVVPDIMTVGKGMAGGFPVSAVIATTEVASSKPWSNPSGSSSSYGGNPFASAACDATLSIITEEKLVENSRRVGSALLKRLSELQDRFPWVGRVAGRGLLIGVDLVSDRKTRQPLPGAITRELFDEALNRGLLSMCYNHNIRINPPLVITMEEAMRGADIFEESLAAVAKRHGKASG
ncbi:MAG: aspartate aminotransferase family protein [Elusimicrobia bacterium]|nr:aspartate aminotransferase family protein [Elusimicrobiota bacterium]